MARKRKRQPKVTIKRYENPNISSGILYPKYDPPIFITWQIVGRKTTIAVTPNFFNAPTFAV